MKTIELKGFKRFKKIDIRVTVCDGSGNIITCYSCDNASAFSIIGKDHVINYCLDHSPYPVDREAEAKFIYNPPADSTSTNTIYHIWTLDPQDKKTIDEIKMIEVPLPECIKKIK